MIIALVEFLTFLFLAIVFFVCIISFKNSSKQLRKNKTENDKHLKNDWVHNGDSDDILYVKTDYGVKKKPKKKKRKNNNISEIKNTLEK
jgi:hypothetical protein